jgi:phospholipid-binding lipoprotein MlaA
MTPSSPAFLFYLRLMGIIHIIKRAACMAVFFTFLAVSCAHGAGDSSPDGQSDTSSRAHPGMVSSDPEQRAPESKEMPMPSASKETGSGENLESTPRESLESPEVPVESGNTGAAGGEYQDAVQEGTEEAMTIADPLEPFNRAMFVFNDRFYFWMLKPVAQGYGAIVPEVARVGVRNFFSNLGFPIRFINCLLQADFYGATTEIGRFGINTTIGIVGFMDPASSKKIDLRKQDTDLGLTLAFYGAGHGFYIDWPILGPSSPRDSFGLAGDYFLYPVSYIKPWYASFGVRGYEEVNAASLRIGDYESLKEAAIDPYVALRDAYVQYRRNQMNERMAKKEQAKPSQAQ